MWQAMETVEGEPKLYLAVCDGCGAIEKFTDEQERNNFTALAWAMEGEKGCVLRSRTIFEQDARVYDVSDAPTVKVSEVSTHGTPLYYEVEIFTTGRIWWTTDPVGTGGGLRNRSTALKIAMGLLAGLTTSGEIRRAEEEAREARRG